MNDPMDPVCRTLVGNELVGSNRAAEMEMFSFGDEVSWQDRRGRVRTVPRFGLHVQCAWRIVREGRVVVGSDDLLEPRSDLPDKEHFDANEIGVTRREELLEEFFKERGARPRVVEKCEFGEAGWLRLTLDQDCALELFPDGSAQADTEYWRLLDVVGEHIVVGGMGVKRLPPIEYRGPAKSA